MVRLGRDPRAQALNQAELGWYFSVVVGGVGGGGGGRNRYKQQWAWLRGTGWAQQLSLFSQIQLSLSLWQGASFQDPVCSIMTQSSRP